MKLKKAASVPDCMARRLAAVVLNWAKVIDIERRRPRVARRAVDALAELEALIGPGHHEAKEHVRAVRELAQALPTADYEIQYSSGFIGGKRRGKGRPDLELFRTSTDLARLEGFDVGASKEIGRTVLSAVLAAAAEWEDTTLEAYYRASRRGVVRVRAAESPLREHLDDLATQFEVHRVEMTLPLEGPRTRRRTDN